MEIALNIGIIDAHVHLWDVDVVPLPWFRDDLGLPRRASTDALGRCLSVAGVESAIAVQAADSRLEAQWLVDTVRDDPIVRRVILQYDPARRMEKTPAAIAGIRAAVPQFAADLSDVPGLDDLADRLAAQGKVLELLIRPAQLPAAGALSRSHPSAAIVVCHLGLGSGAPDASWRDALREAASAPGLHAKVSGLALPSRSAEESRDLVRHAFDAFGTERLLYGSDWPMSVRSCTYVDVLAATRAALPAGTDATGFWSATAARLYVDGA